MTATLSPRSTPPALLATERRLPQIRDTQQRLDALDALCAYYAYTSGRKTRTYLRQLAELQRLHPHPDIRLSLLLNTATLEGLLYNHGKAQQLYTDALPLVEARGDNDEVIEVCIDFAGTCMNLDRATDAAALLDRAERMLDQLPNARLYNRLLIRRAYLALNARDLFAAINHFHTAQRHYLQADYAFSIKDFYFQTLLHSGLGKINLEDDNPERCRESYARAVQLCETHGLRNRLSYHYLYLGNAHLALADHLKAEEYYRKSLDQEDDSSPAARASAYANLGKIYIDQQRYNMALEMFDKSTYVYKNTQSAADYENRAQMDQWRAQVMTLDRNEAAVIGHLISAYENAERSGADWLLIEVKRQVADYFVGVGNYREAYEWERGRNDDLEGFYERRAKQSLERLRYKHEAEIRKQETETLRLRASALRMQALRAQMNPHFVFNALNAIQYDIENNSAVTAGQSLTKFADLMRSNLAYSELDRISIEDEIIFLQRYLAINTTLRFEGRMSYRFHLDNELEEDIMTIPTMLIQPYVENSIEHGLRARTDGHIDIRFELLEEDEDTLRVVVEDNGVGREAAAAFNRDRRKEHRSMGTRITRDRLALLHPDRPVDEILRIEDRYHPDGTAAGTTVVFLLPISE